MAVEQDIIQLAEMLWPLGWQCLDGRAIAGNHIWTAEHPSEGQIEMYGPLVDDDSVQPYWEVKTPSGTFDGDDPRAALLAARSGVCGQP